MPKDPRFSLVFSRALGKVIVDAAGFAVLVDALKRMQQHCGEFVLSGPTVGVKQALDTAGLDKAFVVTPAWVHPAHGGSVTSMGTPGFRRSS